MRSLVSRLILKRRTQTEDYALARASLAGGQRAGESFGVDPVLLGKHPFRPRTGRLRYLVTRCRHGRAQQKGRQK